MDIDYIIVGQGIAGTALSFALLQKKKKILVVDKSSSTSSSKAAAGIYNPVTGKRLVKTWEADRLFPYLQEFYTSMEKATGVSFLHQMPIYLPFNSIEEQNVRTAQTSSTELMPYTETRINHQKYAPFIHNSYGGLQIKQSGYVEVNLMLHAFKDYLLSRQAYMPEEVSYKDLIINEKYVEWKGIKTKKILFCEGTNNEKNPYFNWLPFKQVKGELLIIHIPGFELNEIINRGIFILPMGNQMFKVGATYVWDDLSPKPTAQAREELTGRLKELLKIPFEVVGQVAGIRPASLDRRPFIGVHPDVPVLGVFNGLGTKGISIAPYFAHTFVDYLEESKDLPREVHIGRYFSLYYKTKL